MHSALNQNLDAEIALYGTAGESTSNIRVSLAPPEKFDEAGVPWSYFLSKIKFKPVTKADGSVIIKLTSKEVLNEPFLDFLLEVSWDKGNLYREFTVLVDPPVAYTRPVIPVVQKAKQTSGTSQRNRVIADTAFNNTVSVDKYAVNRNDTLWKVAEKVNTDNDISIEQMMMAIYEANPNAFFKKNVNALKAGHTLDIPEREIILRLSQNQATATFKQQNNVWRGQVAAKAQQTADDARIKSQLDLVAPIDDEITEKNVLTGNNTSAKTDSGQSETDKLAIATSDEGLALQARMAKMEQQLTMMQKMLALKDEQIAALQNQKKITETTDITEAPIDTTKKIIEPKTGQTEIDVKSEPKVDITPQPKPKPTPVVQIEPESDFMSDILTKILTGIGIALVSILGVIFWRKRKIEADAEADAESMFASASEISLPDTTAEDSSALAMDGATSYDVGTVGESSFLSEFTPSDFDAFDSDQSDVDPISEADVYLAYGRYQQAEELMRQAIEDFPERDECKLKLLEIFYANENKSAFEEYATELADSGKNTNVEFWSKVVEMGSELDPDSDLYVENMEGEAVFESTQSDQDAGSENTFAEAKTTGEGNEPKFDLSVFDEDDEFEIETGEKVAEDSGLDFDLSVFEVDETSADEAETEGLETVEFDLNNENSDDLPLKEELELGEESSESDDIESFEFDLGTAAAEVDTNTENIEELDLSTEAETGEDLESFDFSLDNLSETSSTESPENVKNSIEALEELGAEVSDLTDMDELETKIDLAKAYIDMGDTDAAKKIAEEVMENGNVKQKKAAEAIFEQLK
jgi:pilus assembly protein FimV